MSRELRPNAATRGGTRRLARAEGILVGGSSRMTVVAGAAEWLAGYGFVAADKDVTIADVLRRKRGALPEMVHLHPTETVR